MLIWRTFARRWISIRIEGFFQKGAASVLALLAVRARYKDPRASLRGLVHSYGASCAQIRPDKVAPIMGTHQTGGTRARSHQFARLTLARQDERTWRLYQYRNVYPPRSRSFSIHFIRGLFFFFRRDIRVGRDGELVGFRMRTNNKLKTTIRISDCISIKRYQQQGSRTWFSGRHSESITRDGGLQSAALEPQVIAFETTPSPARAEGQ